MATATTFPTAQKHEPIFTINSRLHRKVSNADGQKDPSAIRAAIANGNGEAKIAWFVPIDLPGIEAAAARDAVAVS